MEKTTKTIRKNHEEIKSEISYPLFKNLMTYRQLNQWLSCRLGEIKKGNKCSNSIRYDVRKENQMVSDDIYIRYWNSDLWVRPSYEIYDKDCVNHDADELEELY